MIENTILFGGIALIILYFVVPDNKLTRKINNTVEELKLLFIGCFLFFPIRCIYLVGRIGIAMIAQYGLYMILNDLTTTMYPTAELEVANRNIFIFEQFIWIIVVYLYYDIFSTLFKILRDIKVMIKNRHDSN